MKHKHIIDTYTRTKNGIFTIKISRYYFYDDNTMETIVKKQNKFVNLLQFVFTNNIAIAIYWLIAIYVMCILFAALPIGNN